MREDCRTPNPALRLGQGPSQRGRERACDRKQPRSCTGRIEDLSREERYMDMGGVGTIQGGTLL